MFEEYKVEKDFCDDGYILKKTVNIPAQPPRPDHGWYSSKNYLLNTITFFFQTSAAISAGLLVKTQNFAAFNGRFRKA